MRIAIVSRRVSGLSGATSIIIENARRLAAGGWSVHVYAESLDRDALAQAQAHGHRVPAWPWGSYFKRWLFAVVCERLLERGGFDLVHGHGDIFAQDVLSLHNCVHAAHEAVHGEPLPPGSGVGRIHARMLCAGRFRLLIANSRLMQEDVCRRFGVPRAKIEVVYPGYAPARFCAADRPALRGPMRAKLGVREDEILFGLIVSGDFVKRAVATFIEAFSRLRREGVAAKALVVGKESRLGPYLRRAAREGVGEALRFLPPMDAIERCYHALDVCVHPARYEEFGMSVQEALACGVPVITGLQVGAAELLTGAPRDFLLRHGDPGELAAKMTTLARDAVLRRRLGELGPAAVAGNTWDRHFAATLACYERLLKDSAPKGIS